MPPNPQFAMTSRMQSCYILNSSPNPSIPGMQGPLQQCKSQATLMAFHVTAANWQQHSIQRSLLMLVHWQHSCIMGGEREFWEAWGGEQEMGRETKGWVSCQILTLFLKPLFLSLDLQQKKWLLITTQFQDRACLLYYSTVDILTCSL